MIKESSIVVVLLILCENRRWGGCFEGGPFFNVST